MSALTIVGAQVVCYINGGLYAQVSGFEWDSKTPKKPIRGIDNPHPAELAPTISEVSATLQCYRLTGDGGFQGVGAISAFPDLSREKYFSFQMVDLKSKTVLFQADFCSSTNERWRVAAKGLMTGTMSFEGIFWNNETAAR